jgi:hypothetical protein
VKKWTELLEIGLIEYAKTIRLSEMFEEKEFLLPESRYRK